LYIDADTIRKAKEIGLNLSKVSENALKDAVRRMSEPKGETMHNGGAENGEVDRWVFTPN
jgi:post-segregation antitoxin (ccd killing protein)